jgi:hypothetical protein
MDIPPLAVSTPVNVPVPVTARSPALPESVTVSSVLVPSFMVSAPPSAIPSTAVVSFR